MKGRFVLQYINADDEVVASEAFETAEAAQAKANAAPADVDVWLVPVATSKAKLLRKRGEKGGS